MNIKEHIEAGHYPKDDRGRALVPSKRIVGGFHPSPDQHQRIVTICATDKPGKYCLLGWCPSEARVGSVEMAWDVDGTAHEANSYVSLLPPPPRKVPLVANIQCVTSHGHHDWVMRSFTTSGRHSLPWVDSLTFVLTGEYEEPWA